MIRKIFPHECSNCHRTYHSTEESKVFCSSACEAALKYNGRPYKKRWREAADKKEKHVDKQEKKINKPRKYRDLKSIMYADTFKKWVPKEYKVMRG
jgi:protein-arginine kinase activator protein McsA